MRFSTPAALEMAVKAAAKKSSMDTNRAISGFYFHRFLCRVFSDGGNGFVLKGGQSMLARTIDARYTRDIDLLSKDGDPNAAIAQLRRLASIDLGDFVRFQFEDSRPIKLEDEYRSGANVSFSAWIGRKMVQTVSIDLVVDLVDGISTERIVPKDRIEVEGVETFDYVVYGVEDALADKLLGIVEEFDGRPSSRVKDLVDILVYASTCTVDAAELSKRVHRESSLRKVKLPGTFAVPAMWHENYRLAFRKLVGQTGVDVKLQDMQAAEELAARLFDPALSDGDLAATWSPGALYWEQKENDTV